MGEWKFLFVYVTFLLVLGVILSLEGADAFIDLDPSLNITAPAPPAPTGFDVLTTLVYIVDNITFLFSLAFVTPFSAIGIISWFAIAGGIVSLYIVFRLIRGGG